MSDLILGFLAGSAVAGITVWQVLAGKQKQELQKAMRDRTDALDALRDAFAKEKMEMKKVHDRSFARVCEDLSFREAEIEIVLAADRHFNEAQNGAELIVAFEKLIETRFAKEIQCFVSWTHDDARPLAVTKAGREDINYLTVAKKNGRTNELFESSQPIKLSGEDLQAIPDGFKPKDLTLVYLPLVAHDRRIGISCAYFVGDSHAKSSHIFKCLIEKFAHTLHRLARIEEEYSSSRIDPQTGLPNDRAVYDFLPAIVKRATPEFPLALFFIECDNFADINEKYGHAVGDLVVQDLVELIKHSARMEELNSARPSDQYIRYGPAQFLMISQEADGTQCLAVAERIRQAVDDKVDWPRGVPACSVSIGIALSPDDAEDAKELVAKAEVAAMYVYEQDHGNGVVRFDQVPRHFRATKLSSRVSGSLDVFEPSVTLQSVARANGKGTLTVTNTNGRVFWAFFNDGTMEKAYLDDYKGDVAVVEFLSTFEEGRFDFREYHLLDSEALEYIHRLDDTYDVKNTLDRNLLDGALAQDQLSEAHRLLPNPRMFVKPTGNFKEVIAALPTSKDPPTRTELEAMVAICRHINGRTMLSAIIDRLHSYPTHLRWHAAALLVKHRAVELSKLALSFSV